MGVKDLKTRKVVNMSLDKELLKKLDEYAEQTKIPKTRIVDKALELLFEKVDKNEKIF